MGLKSWIYIGQAGGQTHWIVLRGTKAFCCDSTFQNYTYKWGLLDGLISEFFFNTWFACCSYDSLWALSGSSFLFCSVPSWSGVCEEAAVVVTGPQPADQHQRTEGNLHPPSPGLLAQPPGRRGGSGKQCPAPHAGPEIQQPHWGNHSNSWSLSALDLIVQRFSFVRSGADLFVSDRQSTQKTLLS